MNGRNPYPCCRVWRSDQGYSGQLGKGQELSPAHLSSSILAVTLRCPFTCHSWTDPTIPSSTHFFPPSGVQCSYPGVGLLQSVRWRPSHSQQGSACRGATPTPSSISLQASSSSSAQPCISCVPHLPRIWASYLLAGLGVP